MDTGISVDVEKIKLEQRVVSQALFECVAAKRSEGGNERRGFGKASCIGGRRGSKQESGERMHYSSK